MDRILKVERNYILGMIKKIRSTKCNILLVQKSILHKIEDVESEDIEFISKTLNCLPIILPQSTYTWKLSKISRLFPK
jgi:T-complex protein 1 subunit delta